MTPLSESERSYSLKAACKRCGRYGRIDDITLVCRHCGAEHELTDAERVQRDSDLALWAAYTRS